MKNLEPGKVELPWTWERVSGSFEMGMEFTYNLSGTDAKGKELKDQLLCKIPKANDKEVGVVCNTVEKPSKDKGAGQGATLNWSQFSPMFSVEKPTHELKSREKITYDTLNHVWAGLRYIFGRQGPGTSNIAEAIKRDASLVLVLDPFVPFVSKTPGHADARSNQASTSGVKKDRVIPFSPGDSIASPELASSTTYVGRL